MPSTTNRRSFSKLILALFLLTALSHWIVTPIFEIYDEAAHTGFVWHIRQTGQLPTYDPQIPREEQLYGQEASQPPLYYALSALLSLPVSLADFEAHWTVNPHARTGVPLTTHNPNWFLHDWQAEQFPWRGTILAVHIVRAFSIGLALVVLLLIHRFALLVSGGNGLVADASLALVAFNPTFAHLAAGVNNDWLVIALCTAALVLMARRILAVEQATYRQTFILALVIAAAILSKLGGVLLVPLFIWFISWEWRQGRYGLRQAAQHLILAGAVVAALTGWWFLRNLFLYGDPTGTIVHLLYWGDEPGRSLLSILRDETEGMWFSFWGVFGAFSFGLPRWAFDSISVAALLSLAGLGLRLVRRGGWRLRWNPLWSLTLLWLLLVTVGFLRWTTFLSASQGRLLYPALAPLALGMAVGLTGWERWMPPRLFRGLLTTALGALALLSLATPWLILKPGYTPPAYTMATDEALSAPPVGTFGNGIALLGYQFDPTCGAPDASPEESIWVRDGDELCLSLNLVALRELDRDYSFSLQLVAPTAANEPVAQIDTYPGGGLLPTSDWPPLAAFTDTYKLPVRFDVYAPAGALLQLVMYDLQTQERFSVTIGEEAVAQGDILPLVALRLVPTMPESAEIEPVRFGESVELVGMETLAVDGQWRLRTYWRALENLQQEWQLFVHQTESPAALPLSTYDHPLGGAAFPTPLWQEGDMVVDETVLAAPPSMEQLYVGVYDAASGTRLSATHEGNRLEADAFRLSMMTEAQVQ